MLTAATSVPIVPCHLAGTFRAFPPPARLPRPRKVRLRIGRPLVFDTVPNDRAGWEHVVSEVEARVRRLAESSEVLEESDDSGPGEAFRPLPGSNRA